jgi:hypothetical protein
MKLYKKKIIQQKKRKKTPNRGNTFPVRWLQFPATEETHFRCGGYNIRRVSNQPRYFDLIFFG